MLLFANKGCFIIIIYARRCIRSAFFGGDVYEICLCISAVGGIFSSHFHRSRFLIATLMQIGDQISKRLGVLRVV